MEFIRTFFKQRADDEQWEYFLHKVWDKSYPEFQEALQTAQSLHNMSETDIETTVQKSMNILENFSPPALEEGDA